jgi:hypothetical protein
MLINLLANKKLLTNCNVTITYIMREIKTSEPGKVPLVHQEQNNKVYQMNFEVNVYIKLPQ